MEARRDRQREQLSKSNGNVGKDHDADEERNMTVSQEHSNSFIVKLRKVLHRTMAFTKLTKPSSVTTVKKDFEDIPLIDFSLAETNMKAYLAQLKYALEDVGFGIFVNVPGFDQHFQDLVFEQSVNFFARTQEQKDRMGIEHSPSLRGYFRLDDAESLHKAYAEALRFGAEQAALEGSGIPFWLKLHEGPNQWPSESELPDFRRTLETIFERYHSLNISLNKHVAELLAVSQDTIDDFYPEQLEFNSAMWHYLPITPELKKHANSGFVNGMHEHRDPSTFLTCLIQSRPGLQVQTHAGKWIDVPMVDGGVVCNVGMQLMRLTGGKFVATTHRVNTLLIDEDRYTIPYVLSTKLTKHIVPLPQFSNLEIAKKHVQPNKKVLALMAVEDPGIRSGYARLSLFPAVGQKMYPKEWEEAKALGIV